MRHVSISKDPDTAAHQNGENARDTNQILLSKLNGRIALVRRYAAKGSTAAKINLVQTGERPIAVMLARASLSNSPGDDIAAVGRSNFYHDSLGLGVYEPSGLAANTLYDLLFLILE